MSFGFRTWFIVIAITLVAEDFQYVLETNVPVLEQMEDFSEDCENDGSENKSQKEEEKKEEQKQKDEENHHRSNPPLNAHSTHFKNVFQEVLAYLSNGLHDLETPPPEL